MRITIFSRNGVKRSENQDSLLINKTAINDGYTFLSTDFNYDAPFFLLIMDGIGGSRGGRIASSEIAKFFSKIEIPPSIPNITDQANSDRFFVETSLKKARVHLASISKKNPELARMGSTIAGILVREKICLVFNSGDSRVYRFTEGNLEQASHDHSLFQEFIDSKQLNKNQERSFPYKNVITSSISVPTDANFRVHVRPLVKISGDAYFLCSDGVWGLLGEDEIREALVNRDVLVKLPEKLSNKGQHDDASFIYLETAPN